MEDEGGLSKFYLIIVLLLMLILPGISVLIEGGVVVDGLSLDLVGKWFIFWGIEIGRASCRERVSPYV